MLGISDEIIDTFLTFSKVNFYRKSSIVPQFHDINNITPMLMFSVISNLAKNGARTQIERCEN